MALIQNFPNNHIDDNNVSNVTGYSSQKIESEFNYLIWNGTHAEWEALPASEQAKYEYVFFTDDETPSVIANPTVTDVDVTLTSVTINDENYKVNTVPIYDIMPSKADLIAMPNGTLFRTSGFYSKTDGAGGLYRVDGNWTMGVLVLQDSPRKQLVALNDDGSTLGADIHLVRYGVRKYGFGAIDWDAITPENTYATLNSDIIDSLYNVGLYGADYVLPVGRFFFERTLLLNKNGCMVGLRGSSSVWRVSNADMSGYLAGTTLYFPFLTTDGANAVSTNVGNVSNVTIVGSPRNYNFHIDRTKTITAPNEVVSETIKTVSDTPIKVNGLYKAGGNVQNVATMYFYTGIYCASANIYINNVYSTRCHFGLNIGNDIKCVGVYGWDVHTLLRIRGSISSATSVRVDSCVHALSVTGGSGITVTDLDGDYCTDSLIALDGDDWGVVQHSVFTGIHGRCNTLKCFDNTQSSGVDVRELQDTNGYGIIRVGDKANFNDNIIELNTVGNANPFDSASNYRTPQIILTAANNGRFVRRNILKFSDANATSEEFILKSYQAKSGSTWMQARFDTATNIYLLDNGTVSLEAIIDDSDASVVKTYSSEKIEQLISNVLNTILNGTANQ